MTEELAQNQSPLPKAAKKMEVVKEEETAGYQIVLTFNAKAQLEDFAFPANMDPLLVLEHLTFAANWWAHEMVEKAREKSWPTKPQKIQPDWCIGHFEGEQCNCKPK